MRPDTRNGGPPEPPFPTPDPATATQPKSVLTIQAGADGGRSRARAECGVCHREVPVRDDGRLRGHLAVHGRRQTCEGSGAFASPQEQADPEPYSEPPYPRRRLFSYAAAVNARAEWDKANTLYWELQDMRQAGAASMGALLEARAACARAYDYACELDPMRLT